jgi:hypothetical protein
MESERDQVSRADIYSILVRFAYYLVSTVSQAFNYGTITAIVATKLGPDGLTGE